MRLALLGLVAASLSALTAKADLAAAPVSHVSISAVTLAATFSQTGTPTEGAVSNNRYTVTTRVSRLSYSNTDLLNILLESDQLPDSTIRGWAIVGVWADWTGAGNSFRFFARKKIGGVYQHIPLASSLRVELLEPFVAKNLRLKSGEIASGGDYFKAYTRVVLSDPRPGAVGVRRVPTSTVLGMIGGSGRYARPSGAAEAIYLPDRTSFLGYAETKNDLDEDMIAALTLRTGTATAQRYTLNVPPATSGFPAVSGYSRGTDATPVSLP